MRAPAGFNQVVITPSSTDLCVKTIFILGVNLKDQAGIVADTAPKRQVEENLLAGNAALLDNCYKLLQFG